MGFVVATPGGSEGHSGSHGVLGFVENLVKDVGDAARGAPEGAVQLVTHPIRTAENVGKATWQDWSPLFEGHVGKFAHQFYDHPLAPMLDIATVFTGGASVAAKLGTSLEKAGAISGDSALARLGKMPKAVDVTPKGALIPREKLLPTNPIYNKVSRTLMDQADKNPLIPNWFSASRTYGRLEAKSWSQSGLALNATMSAMLKAGDVFNKAGHRDWAYLERQLFSQNYSRLLDHSETIPLKTVMENGGKAPEGWVFVKHGVDTAKPLFKNGHAENLDQFANHVRNLGDKFTTHNIREATGIVGPDGQPLVKIAHQSALRHTFEDGARSTHMLAKIARFPTQVWKAVTLGYSPRVLVNNGIGNWLMYAMRQGGAHSIKGFVDAVRYTKGERAAMQMLKETGKLPAKEHFLNHYFAPELGNTFGSALLDLGKEGTGDSLISKSYRHSLYPLVHKYADVPVRAASISAYLRDDPSIQALMKKDVRFEDAAYKVLRGNHALRDRAIQHARTVAGNYITLTKGEQAVRDFIPFYLWDKHIGMHAVNMLRDRPGRVAVGSAVGQEGADQTRKQLGNIPSWMIGALPLPFKAPGAGSRATVLNTQGMNPYSSIPDLVGLAQALTTGHTEDSAGDLILGTVNPVIKGLVEHMMGQKASGAPVTNHGGVLPSTLVDIFNSLRPVQVGRSAAGITPPPGKNPKLYKTDINSILSSMMGFPIQEPDLARAAQLAAQIANGGKKPKKGSSKYIIGT